MTQYKRPLAIVTGASSGIGYELARICAKNGNDLLIAADEPRIDTAARELQSTGVDVEFLQADLSKQEEVDRVCTRVGDRPVDFLIANAGHGLGHAFLDQPFDRVRHIIDTNITGTIYLIQRIGKHMRARSEGKILITGSIAGFMPGTYQAVYNGTKAFIDSFSFALRAELRDSDVTGTCLLPGATETRFFERAEMLDTEVGQAKKDTPQFVAQVGYDAMMRGDGDVVAGWKNKIQAAVAHVAPVEMLAELHRKKAEPGSGKTSGRPRKRA